MNAPTIAPRSARIGSPANELAVEPRFGWARESDAGSSTPAIKAIFRTIASDASGAASRAFLSLWAASAS